jgi:hypothetical protein
LENNDARAGYLSRSGQERAHHAVEEAAYEAVFEEPIGELLLLQKRLRVIVFDSDTEEIRRWIS